MRKGSYDIFMALPTAAGLAGRNAMHAKGLVLHHPRSAWRYTRPVVLGSLRNTVLAAGCTSLLGMLTIHWLSAETFAAVASAGLAIWVLGLTAVIISGGLEKSLQRKAHRQSSTRMKIAVRLTCLCADALFFDAGGLGALLFLTWLCVYSALT
jgi:hypothetical protein